MSVWLLGVGCLLVQTAVIRRWLLVFIGEAVELESWTIALDSESHYFFIADLCDFRNYIKCFSLGNYVSSSKKGLGS